MIKFIIYGNNKASFIQKVNELNPTVRYSATIVEYKSKRSDEQRKWSRNYAAEWGKHIGYEADEAYQLLMYVHNPKFIVNKETGEEIRMPGHFSDLNTKEAADVQEAILRHGESMGFFFDI